MDVVLREQTALHFLQRDVHLALDQRQWICFLYISFENGAIITYFKVPDRGSVNSTPLGGMG